MGKRLVITEKPSVANDIADALGGFTRTEEYYENEDYVVTWAVGHLLELANPADYDKKWRSWSIKLLPILPEAFEVKPKDGHKKRLAQIKKLAKRSDVDGLINACDAGREGELIYRRIVEFCGLEAMPQERLWLQSMTAGAIVEAFDNLRPGSQLDNLADAAWLRSVGDWLIGMNATRALTQRLKSGANRKSWSAGRVQTPTLNLLVHRERDILAHKPRTYWEIAAQFTHHTGDGHEWQAQYWNPKAARASDDEDAKPPRIFDEALARDLLARAQTQTHGIASEKRKKSKQKPPLPFDLTSLQREANKRYSMSAKRTLSAAQRLYEGHKVLTYPRTDSRYLPDDYGPVIDQLLAELQNLPKGDWGEHAGLAQRLAASGPLNLDKILDSSKVSDHFAIVPTGAAPPPDLSSDQLRVFDLVVRQFIASMMGPATWATVERLVEIDVGDLLGGDKALFRTTARSLEVPGFLEALGQEAGKGTTLPALEPGSDKVEGVEARADSIDIEEKQTKPPSRYTEAQLLRMMETAGEQIEDEELSDAMKDRGLGTPATRADTIEGLVRKEYAARVSNKLVPSHKAMRLIDVLERVSADGLASPALTGEWEHAFHEVANGTRPRSKVHQDLVDYTTSVTGQLVGFQYEDLYASEPPVGTCPNCGNKVFEGVRGYMCERNTGVGTECDFIIWKERMGRYIDRQLAIDLLSAENHTVGPVDYFIPRNGRGFLQGTIHLTRKYSESRDAEVWTLDVDTSGSEGNDEPEQLLGETKMPCPWEHEEVDDCVILETNHRWVCRELFEEREKKGPQLPKVICKRDMEQAEIEAYFGPEGQTPFIDDFISRWDRPFRAQLVRRPRSGRYKFEFPEREKKKTDKADATEGETKPKRAAAKKSTRAKGKGTAKKKAATKKTTSRKKKASEPEVTTEAPPPVPTSARARAAARRAKARQEAAAASTTSTT